MGRQPGGALTLYRSLMTTPDSAAPAAPEAATAAAPGNLNFVLICVFIDMLGIGLIVPVLPVLVGEFTGSRDSRPTGSAS
jgi:DHA1 family tetracycline resistance protein-like MFS transporter